MIQAGEQLVRVNQDTRLNNRVLDMRTPANQGIFRIQCQVGSVSFYILRCTAFCFYFFFDLPFLILETLYHPFF